MRYRSVSDLNSSIFDHLDSLPPKIGLIVGVPRSGLLVANLLSLAINVPMTDIDGFLAGRILSSGRTKRTSLFEMSIDKLNNILLIDDSINSGKSMRQSIEKIRSSPFFNRVTTCAVYGLHARQEDVDIVLEVVPQPRIFQWNFLHHPVLEQSCLDIDGVLCRDPLDIDNDDGERYISFLLSARPYLCPTRKLGHLVTSRLERYRPQTEALLAANGIEYGKLWMLDLASAEERRRQKAHAPFKAKIYQETGALLFIESEPAQAREIARASGKPVLCIETQDIITPDQYDMKTVWHGMVNARRARSRMGGSPRWKKAIRKLVRPLKRR